MPASGKWVQDGNAINLSSEGGQDQPVSAMDIFQAQFGGAREVRGLLVNKPSQDLPALNLSRYPAEVVAVLESSAHGVKCLLGVQAGKRIISPPPDADQVIVDGYWFPLRRDAVEAARSWISEIAGSRLDPAPLKLLLALRSKSGFPGKVLDRVDEASRADQRFVEVAAESRRGLAADLYPYQAQGLGFLSGIANEGLGCVLADEMGLGKTLQVIALLVIEHNAGRGPSIVVAPATLLENWRRELRQFAPHLTVNIHSGGDRPGTAERLARADVTVVSYETAVRDEPLLSAVRWNVLALDEAQNVKNPSAQRTAMTKRLPRRVAVAVTGTPLENRVDDLWSIVDFAIPGLLGDLDAFRREYVDDVVDANRLGPVVRPILLRRLVTQVAHDLPEKISIPQPLEMTRALAQGYEAVRKGIVSEYGTAANLVATGKLRMYCCHPTLVGASGSGAEADMPKLQRLTEICDEIFATGEKALVFTSYTGASDLLLQVLASAYPGAFFKIIDGRLAVDERQPLVDSFFEHAGPGALILNPKAAGVGLNITAANHVIHYNPEWNPALTDQATARAFRRKQTRPVTVHHMFFVKTVEEVIMSRAAFKRKLAVGAVTGHEGDVEISDIARALRISPLEEDALQ